MSYRTDPRFPAPRPAGGAALPIVTVRPLLIAGDVGELLGVTGSTVWRMVARKELPPPTRLGPRLLRWPSEDVLAWLAGRGAALVVLAGDNPAARRPPRAVRPLLSARELGAVLGCTDRTVINMSRRAELPRPVKVNRKAVRWPASALVAFLGRRGVELVPLPAAAADGDADARSA